MHRTAIHAMSNVFSDETACLRLKRNVPMAKKMVEVTCKECLLRPYVLHSVNRARVAHGMEPLSVGGGAIDKEMP